MIQVRRLGQLKVLLQVPQIELDLLVLYETLGELLYVLGVSWPCWTLLKAG